MDEANLVLSALQKGDLSTSFEKFKSLIRSGFLLDDQLIPCDKKRNRITFCIRFFVNFVQKLKAENGRNKLCEDVFDLSVEFIRRSDIAKETELLIYVVNLFHNLSVFAYHQKYHEICLKALSIAIVFSLENGVDKFLKVFCAAKIEARTSNDDLSSSFIAKTVVDLLGDLQIMRPFDKFELLRREFLMYYSSSSNTICMEWCYVVVMQMFKVESSSIQRANSFLLLAKVLYVDDSFTNEKAADCCAESIRLLNIVKEETLTRSMLLCEAFLWQHLCLMQEKRKLIVDELSMSKASDQDLFSDNDFRLPPSKVYCSLNNFTPINDSFEKCISIWRERLIGDFESSDIKSEIVNLTSTLANVALIIPKPLFAHEAFNWLLSKRKQFSDFLCLAGLFYDENVHELCSKNIGEECTDDFSRCAKNIFLCASHCCSNNISTAATVYNECQAALSNFDKKQGSFFRLYSMLRYVETFFLRRPFRDIPAQFKASNTSLVTLLFDSYRKAVGILKGDIGVDFNFGSQLLQTQALVAYDCVWCLRRMHDLASIHEQSSLPREALFYYAEGFEMAKRLAYPYWTSIFLNGYLKVSFLFGDNDASPYLEASRKFFDFSTKSCSERKKLAKCVSVYSVDENVTTSNNTERVRRVDRSQSASVEIEEDVFVDDDATIDPVQLMHVNDCKCVSCTDPFIRAAKEHFVSIIWHLKTPQKISLGQEDNMLSLETFANDFKKSSNLKSLLSFAEATVPNYLFSFLRSFCLDRFLWLVERMVRDNQLANALDLIEAILKHFFAVGSMANFHSLTFSFLREKIKYLSCVGCKDLASQLADLTLTKKKKPAKPSKKKKEEKTESSTDKYLFSFDVASKDLENFGHLLFYPWYRNMNEFVFMQRIEKPIPANALRLIESIGISVRHSATVLEHKKMESGLNPGYPISRFLTYSILSSKLKQLPKDLTVICLYLNENKELWLIRMSARHENEPVFVNLKKVLKKFDALIEIKEINKEIKRSVQVSDKNKYWNERFEVDARLKKLVELIEETWFGKYKSLLLGFGNDENCVNDYPDISNATFEVLCNASKCLNGKDLEELVRKLVADKLNASELKRLLTNLSFKFESSSFSRNPVVLILDKEITGLPFETMPILQNQPVSRYLSLHSLIDSLENWKLNRTVDPSNVYYIVNPSRDLMPTEELFASCFQNTAGWSGSIGKPPPASEVQDAIEKKDLIVYCGHGSGYGYGLGNSNSKLSTCRSSLFLMGCSSGKYVAKGSYYEGQGVISTYQLMKAPSVVACLWEVTDRDIDCYLEHLLCIWLRYKDGKPNKNCVRQKRTVVPETTSLLDAVTKARQFCKLTYLTGSALVVYGLPVDSLR